MQRSWVVVLAWGLLVSWATVVSGQSLADVARQEQARRKATGTSSKTYTNKDLKQVPAQPASSQPTKDPVSGSASSAAKEPDAGAPATAADAARSEAKSAPESSALAEADRRSPAFWRARITSLREQLERDILFAEALQSRINALTTDFVNRDDPVQRGQIGDERQKAIAELERLQQTIQKDKQQIAAFEEEARRAGVPPGWLR